MIQPVCLQSDFDTCIVPLNDNPLHFSLPYIGIHVFSQLSLSILLPMLPFNDCFPLLQLCPRLIRMVLVGWWIGVHTNGQKGLVPINCLDPRHPVRSRTFHTDT
eukprot:m.54396 g.54396  ORF g.54396 m.54396 type:complete len:104 (+) comp11412_c0_seq2:82-393(+)